MPAPFGLQPTGFSAKTLEDILGQIQDDCKNTISPIVNLQSYTVLGQYNGIISSKLSEVWDQLQLISGMLDPASASDTMLGNVSMLTGTKRKDADYSVVYCTVNLDAGTYAPGTLIASVLGNPSARFANTASVVSAGSPLSNVKFQALSTGPVAAPAGTLTVRTPVTGWNSVTNPADAALGHNVESDPSLRLRRAAELAAAGSASDFAMKSAVQNVAGVVYAEVASNDGDTVNAAGLAPHSQEVVIFDGLVPAATNNDVAQAICNNKTGGIQQVGTTSGTAVDGAGNSHIVYFTRVEIVPLYIGVTLQYIAGEYIGDAAVISALKSWGDASLFIGTDVRINKIIAQVIGLDGVQEILSVQIDTVNPPVATANYPISNRRIAALDTGRIFITSSPVAAT